MPKKPPKGAFFFFLIDYKKRCEQNGERFPGGLRDEQLKELAGAEWMVKLPEDKKKYEDMAKEEKLRAKNGTAYRETNMHHSFASIDRQKREEEEQKDEMNKWIENKIVSLSTKSKLAEGTFYVFHGNYFCVTNNSVYHPAELAIAEFSLLKGVTNVFHRIIDPGEFPLGTLYDAKQKSEQTHKIPLQENGGEKDFYKLFMEIKEFLEPGRVAEGGKYPPMFTMQDNINLNTSISCVKSIFTTLADIVNEPVFRVYSLEKLFFELKNACSHLGGGCEFPQMSFAQIELEQDSFNFTSHIACSFHVREDAVLHCSKSFVQRWVFLICDHCCKDMDIEVIPGKHVPLNADTKFKETVRELTEKKEPKKFTWIDHSKPSTQDFIPVHHEPLPQARAKPNLAAMRDRPVTGDLERDFPMMSLGRGRVGDRAPRGRGYSPLNFAAAAKK